MKINNAYNMYNDRQNCFLSNTNHPVDAHATYFHLVSINRIGHVNYVVKYLYTVFHALVFSTSIAVYSSLVISGQ